MTVHRHGSTALAPLAGQLHEAPGQVPRRRRGRGERLLDRPVLDVAVQARAGSQEPVAGAQLQLLVDRRGRIPDANGLRDLVAPGVFGRLFRGQLSFFDHPGYESLLAGDPGEPLTALVIDPAIS